MTSEPNNEHIRQDWNHPQSSEITPQTSDLVEAEMAGKVMTEEWNQSADWRAEKRAQAEAQSAGTYPWDLYQRCVELRKQLNRTSWLSVIGLNLYAIQKEAEKNWQSVVEVAEIGVA